jgi:hypothetical protein
MAGADKGLRFGVLVLVAALMAAAPVSAQGLFGLGAKKWPPLTRDQVRLKLLDNCVMSQSGKAADQGAGPKCGCYATRVSKVLTDQDILAYSASGKLTPGAQGEATKAFDRCGK